MNKQFVRYAKVRVINGDFKGAIGYLVGTPMTIGDNVVWSVEPNENADVRSFYEKDLEVLSPPKSATKK